MNDWNLMISQLSPHDWNSKFMIGNPMNMWIQLIDDHGDLMIQGWFRWLSSVGIQREIDANKNGIFHGYSTKLWLG